MYIAVLSIIIFICILLVLVVLAQNSKGGGLSGQFGGAGASQLMGVKRTGDLLEKLTWTLAIALMVLTLGSHIMLDDTNASSPLRSVNQERAQQLPTAPAPATPQSQEALPDVNPNQEGITAPAEEATPAE